MSLRKLFAQAVAFVGNRVESLKHAGQSVWNSLTREDTLVKRFTEGAKDIIAAIRHPEAMPSKQRHLDEFKLLVGSGAAIAGALELNPLVAAGGSVPAAEAAIEMEHAGHKWRVEHGMRM